MFEQFGINAGFVEEQYLRYLENPQMVDPAWRAYFDTHHDGVPAQAPPKGPNGTGGPGGNGTHAEPKRAELRVDAGSVTAYKQAQVANLVNAYRARGHLYADINPIVDPPASRDDLDIVRFGLSDADLDQAFSTGDIVGPGVLTLRELRKLLEETYCRSIGVEFGEVEEPEIRTWLQQAMETSRNRVKLTHDEQVRLLSRLTDAESLEQFIHRKYPSAKRFSLEGGESLIPMLDLLIEQGAELGLEEIVLGMAHRGRLNVLINTMGKNVRELFAAFDDKHPERFIGSGDVKYHHGYSNDRITPAGKRVHLTLAVNPSHLEFVNPVVEGRVRAKQDKRGDANRSRVMPILVHGDAAFMGQGIVAETLNLAGLDGYKTGGTIHIIVNNQVGFTTDPRDSRSTRYATDIARMMRVPVFHVNGEDPEAVVQVTRLALELRQRFAKDVVIDMYCFRKWGHNEGDEPRFTQPVMYATIDKHPGVREMYLRRLLQLGQITAEQADGIHKGSVAQLSAAYDEAQRGDFAKLPDAFGGVWQPYHGGPESTVNEVDTTLTRAQLLEHLKKITTLPEGFEPNPKVGKLVRDRIEKAERGEPLDWGTGEVLAYATLLTAGVSIRLSGQDCRRGTFAHRHAVLRDTRTGRFFTPHESLLGGDVRFEVWDSPLSEAAVMGFDYGYSLDRPDSLVIWEAQFGDFANGAQVIIDQFLVAGEDKWRRLSGLVLLLPHGYEGQGPEHSSARLERFLQLCAADNIQVCVPTSTSQIFHLLRRQALRKWRKPLVVMSPKSLLRLPEAASPLSEFTEGGFRRVLPDPASPDPAAVRKVLLCSGKVYYDLHRYRTEKGRNDVAIVRLEQLYPLNDQINEVLAPYSNATQHVWVQDEPANMGAWGFVVTHLQPRLGETRKLTLASRAESASPATGSHEAHRIEQRMLIEEAFR